VIDIHAHLLPQIDDGPDDWDEALGMIEAGAKDGIRGAVCTSHVLNRLDEDFEANLVFKFEQLKRFVEERRIPMQLWLGAEIHVNAKFDPLFKTATLAGNGKYLILELPLNDIPNDVDDRLFQLTLGGFRPILAHPERNSAIAQKPEIAYAMVQRGVLLQINAGSLTGDFGGRVRKNALDMLDHNLVHFIASDCHSRKRRPMILSKAYKIVAGRWGKETADALTSENPRTAVLGGNLQAPEPVPFEKSKKRFWL
jgi:protein-tyrosine phosphatase